MERPSRIDGQRQSIGGPSQVVKGIRIPTCHLIGHEKRGARPPRSGVRTARERRPVGGQEMFGTCNRAASPKRRRLTLNTLRKFQTLPFVMISSGLTSPQSFKGQGSFVYGDGKHSPRRTTALHSLRPWRATKAPSMCCLLSIGPAPAGGGALQGASSIQPITPGRSLPSWLCVLLHG